MYRAKDLGATPTVLAATMNHKALEALEVENGLRRALANNEFVLYYQPLVDVTSAARSSDWRLWCGGSIRSWGCCGPTGSSLPPNSRG